MISIEQMMSELRHYTNRDIEEFTVKQIIEAYIKLFGEEEEQL